MKVFGTIIAVVLSMVLVPTSFAETIYKGIDAQGNVVFSDKPLKNVKVIEKVEITIPDSTSKTVAELQAVPTKPQELTKNQPAKEQVLSKLSATSLTERYTQRQELAERIVTTYDALQKAHRSLKQAEHMQALNRKECESRLHRVSKNKRNEEFAACQKDLVSGAQQRVTRLESMLKGYEQSYRTLR